MESETGRSLRALAQSKSNPEAAEQEPGRQRKQARTVQMLEGVQEQAVYRLYKDNDSGRQTVNAMK